MTRKQSFVKHRDALLGIVCALSFLGFVYSAHIRADVPRVTQEPEPSIYAFVGVMVRGQWFWEAELQQMLEELAASYGR